MEEEDGWTGEARDIIHFGIVWITGLGTHKVYSLTTKGNV